MCAVVCCADFDVFVWVLIDLRVLVVLCDVMLHGVLFVVCLYVCVFVCVSNALGCGVCELLCDGVCWLIRCLCSFLFSVSVWCVCD